MKLPDLEKSQMKAKLQGSIAENFYNIVKRKQSGKEHCERNFKAMKNATNLGDLKDQKIEVT